MRGLGFNRLNFVLYAATPLTGYLVLLKTESLLHISAYSYPLLQIFSVVSVLWGVCGAIAIDNIKQKAVYLAMMFWGTVYAFAAFGCRLSTLDFAALLTAAFLFGQVLMLIYTAASNETEVSEMGGFIKNLKLTFVLSLLMLAASSAVLIALGKTNIWLAFGSLVLLLLVSSHILSQIMLGQSRADERVQAMLKNPSPLLWLPMAAAAGLILWHFKVMPRELVPVVLAFLLLFAVRPLRCWDRLYGFRGLQEADYIGTIGELLVVTPVKVLSRLLWLTVDFIFVERTIINSVQNALEAMVFVFRRMHSGTFFAAGMFVLLGFLVIGVVWYYGG